MRFHEPKQIIVFIVAGVMIAGYVVLRYLPLRNRIGVIETQIADCKLAVANAAAQNTQLPVLKEQLAALSAEIKDYDKNIPPEMDLGNFLHQLADLMKKNNLSDQVIQPGIQIKTNNLNCIPISMQCTGRSAQIFSFFKDLENLDRYVRIEQVDLKNDQNFGGHVSMQTKAVIYHMAKKS